MSNLKDSYPVAIVGGGPVGLFLAIALQKKGVDCVVFEKNDDRNNYSRSLGIHPVSLELMEKLEIVNDFLREGIKIKKGVAYNDKGKIGTISFANCPEPYTFVLSLPQFKTEELLERKLNEFNPECLNRKSEVKDFSETGRSLEVIVESNGEHKKINCNFLVGCDGKNSLVRKKTNFTFRGESYTDTYIMGDFSDNTIFDSNAAVFLCKNGLIESFPMSNAKRRWVVKTDEFLEEVDRTFLEKLIAERIGHDVGEEQNFMLSSFGVQNYIAKPMAKGRIFLAGDAAHIVSPIGGQGMNLGWLDAWDLSSGLSEALNKNFDPSAYAIQYNSRRTKAAKKAIRRAELNMWLGRKRKVSIFRNALVWIMLNTPLQRLMAKIFTMRGLED